MTKLKLRILFDGAMMGPGKAALLAGIQNTGSIAAAGREMGMSYKRAWSLVEEMNAAYLDPLVSSARGGPGGGGAQLTATGVKVLTLYQAIVASAEQAAADQIAALAALVSPMRPAQVLPESDMSDGK